MEHDAHRSEASRVARQVDEQGADRQRTYFIHGHRVEETRDEFGVVWWSCDCAEFRRSRSPGLEATCPHTQRVAAAASVDRLLGARQLLLRATGC